MSGLGRRSPIADLAVLVAEVFGYEAISIGIGLSQWMPAKLPDCSRMTTWDAEDSLAGRPQMPAPGIDNI